MWQLAQINISRFVRDKQNPAHADFMNALDHVNALAEASPGFVWRLIGESNNATDIEAVPGDPRLIVNMSLWQDIAALEAFAYRQSDHLAIMRRRNEWFEKLAPAVALWWVKAGHRPDVAEGMAKLALLKDSGPSAAAFTFQTRFATPA